MDKSDIAEFKALYLQTAKEYIEKLRNNQSLTTDEMIAEFFMSAHSLKSQSLVMGYKETGALCSILEKIGRSLKEKSLVSNGELVSTVSQGIEKLAKSVASIESDDQEESTTQEITALETASGLTNPA